MLLGATSTLGGCSAVSALNSAAEPVNTYDLTAVSGSLDGRRTSRTLLVVRPDASAVIAQGGSAMSGAAKAGRCLTRFFSSGSMLSISKSCQTRLSTR